MAEHPHDRNASEYLQAVIEIKPRADDHRDVRIREIIRKIFIKEPWAEKVFANIREEQIAYLKDVVHSVSDPVYVDRVTQETLRKIGGELRATIEEGVEHLTPLQGKPVLVTTNHLGTYKLAPINPRVDLGEDVPKYEGYDFMYPYPLYFAALSPVAEALGNALSYASNDYPGVFGQIHSAAGFIHLPPASQFNDGRTGALKQQTAELFQRRPNTALVNFSEGGTSGKYDEKGPYGLRDFKTGGYVIAAELGLPMLAVAQYFDPLIGMRLKVFEPFYPQTGTREAYQQLANGTQAEIQAWLKLKEIAQDSF
ncbi:MAG TPA: hypothetical protein VLG25_00410 [Patescibacteria group bacterium]|nr:hypothetical protein [Patescibacteria group bacterium]